METIAELPIGVSIFRFSGIRVRHVVPLYNETTHVISGKAGQSGQCWCKRLFEWEDGGFVVRHSVFRMMDN